MDLQGAKSCTHIWHFLSLRLGHKTARANLPLPHIEEGWLSVTGERRCTEGGLLMKSVVWITDWAFYDLKCVRGPIIKAIFLYRYFYKGIKENTNSKTMSLLILFQTFRKSQNLAIRL